uniref:Uncharacterized protein n=1 Tax=Fibrocapsa japonica TaxID=94617 RepID=A0A7S2XVP1_9STRA
MKIFKLNGLDDDVSDEEVEEAVMYYDPHQGPRTVIAHVDPMPDSIKDMFANGPIEDLYEEYEEEGREVPEGDKYITRASDHADEEESSSEEGAGAVAEQGGEGGEDGRELAQDDLVAGFLGSKTSLRQKYLPRAEFMQVRSSIHHPLQQISNGSSTPGVNILAPVVAVILILAIVLVMTSSRIRNIHHNCMQYETVSSDNDDIES